MNIVIGEWGPFDSADDLKKAAPVNQLPDHEIIDELLRYDAYAINLCRAGGRYWLANRFETEGNSLGKDGIKRISYVTHYLSFKNEEDIRATLHHGFAPTLETYEKALDLYRSEQTFDHDATNRTSSNITFKIEESSASILLEDDPVDERQLPGAKMLFKNIPIGENAALEPFFSYPVPVDDTLYYYDGPRSWIGSFPKTPEEKHLVICIDEGKGEYLEHRLDFDSKSEEVFRATLADGIAPTMASYRLANAVWSQKLITHEDGRSSLEVDKINPIKDGWAKPKWDDPDDYAARAQHKK